MSSGDGTAGRRPRDPFEPQLSADPERAALLRMLAEVRGEIAGLHARLDGDEDWGDEADRAYERAMCDLARWAERAPEPLDLARAQARYCASGSSPEAGEASGDEPER